MTGLIALFRASGLNRLWPYLVLSAVVFAVIAATYLQGKSAGSASVKQKQLNDWLNTQYREAKDRADIQSMRSDAARDQLRKRWSSR